MTDDGRSTLETLDIDVKAGQHDQMLTINRNCCRFCQPKYQHAEPRWCPRRCNCCFNCCCTSMRRRLCSFLYFSFFVGFVVWGINIYFILSELEEPSIDVTEFTLISLNNNILNIPPTVSVTFDLNLRITNPNNVEVKVPQAKGATRTFPLQNWCN